MSSEEGVQEMQIKTNAYANKQSNVDIFLFRIPFYAKLIYDVAIWTNTICQPRVIFSLAALWNEHANIQYTYREKPEKLL